MKLPAFARWTRRERGWAFWPFIFIPRRLATPAERHLGARKRIEAYVAHESVHRRRQWGPLALVWVLLWYFSPAFRWREEKLAWTASIETNKKNRRRVTAERYIQILTTQYTIRGRPMCTREQAQAFVESVLSTPRKSVVRM